MNCITMKRASDSRSPEATSSEKKAKLSINNCNLSNVISIENLNMTNPSVGNNLELQTVEVVNAENNAVQVLQDDDGVSGETSLGVLVEFMDITEPLTTLRTLLEQRTGLVLSDYHFYLQDTQELEASKNLVNQCVQGEGLVQINVVISDTGGVKKINIIDVLKPAEEINVSETNDDVSARIFLLGDTTYVESTGVQQKGKLPSSSDDPQQVTRWIIAPQFRKLQEKYKIPNDPCYWSKEFVKIWLEWAIAHFKIPNVDLNDWDITGKELVSVSQDIFKKKILVDPGDLFWTHLELLRKFKIVAVIQQSGPVPENDEEKKKTPRVPRIGPPKIPYEGCPGNNGQIQLWQFLLELLTDKDFRNFIQWVGNEGEFKLIHPEMVAQLWGQRKNKPTMNYEKLSRALRYYYDGDMLAKVHGKRFVYKFVCDLKSLLGYDAFELNRLITECEKKKNDSFQNNTALAFQAVDSNST